MFAVLGRLSLRKPFDIFADHVGFNIHRIPFLIIPTVVMLAVCGIMLAVKLPASQVLMVKLIPSTATEPLRIM